MRLLGSILAVVAGLALGGEILSVTAMQSADLDCTAFETLDEANDYYAQNPDAAAAIDDDNDGVACEVYFGEERRNRREGSESPARSEGESSGAALLAQEAEVDLDCEDFETQEQAQAVFDEDPNDPNNLDPNGDGIACALLPAAAGAEPAAEETGDADAEQTGDADAEQTAQDDREQRRADRRRNRQTEPEEDTGQAVEVTCDQFSTQEDAQAAFDDDPEGLAALDAEGNGVACEELIEDAPADDETRAERRQNRRNQNQGQEEPPAAEAPTSRGEEDLDCVDFEFQEEAQEVYNQDPADPFNLDPNGDGFACSSLPLAEPLVSQVPSTGVGPAIPPAAGFAAAAGVSAALGLIGATRWRRRVR